MHLKKLQMEEIKIYGTNKVFDQAHIKSELEDYRNNVVLLTLVIVFFVSLGVIGVYHQLIGRFLSRITELNQMSSLEDGSESFIQIPNDEMGELIRSRIAKQKRLKKIIDENKTLVRILVHDLNNGLAKFNVLLNLLQKHGENKGPDFRRDKYERLEKTFHYINDLLETVKKIEETSSKNKTEAIETVFLKKMFDDALFIFEKKIADKNLEVQIEEIDGASSVLVDPVLFGNNVVNNLMSNAIKFSKPGQKILITTKIENGTVVLKVRDFGIGMPQKNLENLFSIEENQSRKGTEGEKGTGFGMPLLYSTVTKFEGTTSVSSRSIDEYPDDHGTTFEIRLESSSEKSKPLSVKNFGTQAPSKVA